MKSIYKKIHKKSYLIGMVFSAFSLQSFAVQSCYMFAVGMKEEKKCYELGQATVAGGAYPSLSDAFNLNPASIPVVPTSLGVEVTASKKAYSYGGSDYNFALIKGLNKFGIAMSSNSDNTFYSPKPSYSYIGNITQGSFAPYATASQIPTFNIGAATSVLTEAIKEKLFSNLVLPTFGTMIRINPDRGTIGFGTGFSFNSSWLSLGYSFLREPSTQYLAQDLHETYTASLNLRFLLIDFSYFKNYHYISTQSQDSYIWTASLNIASFTGTYAFKRYEDTSNLTNYMALIGAQFRFTDKFQLGYMYNYVPLAHTMSAQFMLF